MKLPHFGKQALLITALILTTLPAFAQKSGPTPTNPQHNLGEGMAPGKAPWQQFVASLNLSDEQKQAVANIALKYKTERKAIQEKLLAARKAMGDQLFADRFDESALRQLAQSLSAQQQEMIVLVGKMLSEIQPLLSAEQKALIREKRARLLERIIGMGAVRENIMEQWAQPDKGK
jgi:Spy/CpxP family protein refolding chaperone